MVQEINSLLCLRTEPIHRQAMAGKPANGPSVGIPARQIGAVAAGVALEFYDFLTFSLFAIQIGRVFFPAHSSDGSLLLALATFGAGFASRPFGALILGKIGDARGRKPALVVSFSLLGVSVLGLAITPPFSSIGIAAPLLLVGFRLLQGFALGGEAGPSVAFLLESAPAHRRGFYVSLQFAAAKAAELIAGLVGLTLAHTMNQQMLTEFGWRIALLIGAGIFPLGLVLRRGLPETLPRSEPVSFRAVGRHFPILLLGVAMLGGNVIAYYILNYMTTFAGHVLNMPSGVAFGAAVVSGLCGIIFTLIGGYCGDRFGRRPVMLMGLGLLSLSAIPVFDEMVMLKTPFALYAGTAILAALQAFGGAPVLAALSERLPVGVRSTGVGAVFAICTPLFGGTAQFAVAWLTTETGSPLAPAFYMTLMLIPALFAAFMLRQSAADTR